MTKKTLNQNAKYAQDLIDSVEPDFIFNNKPINRFMLINNATDRFKTNKNEEYRY